MSLSGTARPTLPAHQEDSQSRAPGRWKSSAATSLLAAGGVDDPGRRRKETGRGGAVQGEREAAVYASRPSRSATGWRQR